MEEPDEYLQWASTTLCRVLTAQVCPGNAEDKHTWKTLTVCQSLGRCRRSQPILRLFGSSPAMTCVPAKLSLGSETSLRPRLICLRLRVDGPNSLIIACGASSERAREVRGAYQFRHYLFTQGKDFANVFRYKTDAPDASYVTWKAMLSHAAELLSTCI